MPQIKEISIIKTTAGEEDFLALQTPEGETYRITKGDLLAGLSSGGGNPSNSINLNFVTNGDTNGVLYYTGTANNTRPWENPHNNGLIISASSVEAGNVSLLSDRLEGQFYTNSILGSWIKIDIRGAKLKCNRYSLRNRNNNLHYLRNWKFQGSNNDIDWIDLDIQTNNTILATPSQWLSLPVVTNDDYSIFRVITTGLDSSNAYYFCLGEIELYGVYTP
jgi:hypothetical protein